MRLHVHKYSIIDLYLKHVDVHIYQTDGKETIEL